MRKISSQFSSGDIDKERILLQTKLEEIKQHKDKMVDYYLDVIVQLSSKFNQDEVYRLHYENTINKIEERNEKYIENLDAELETIKLKICDIDGMKVRGEYNEY